MTKTQTEVAERMGIKHHAFSKMERKADLYVGTLRKAVEAMGGKLDMIVRFPDRRPVRLGRFHEIEMADGEREPDPDSIPTEVV